MRLKNRWKNLKRKRKKKINNYKLGGWVNPDLFCCIKEIERWLRKTQVTK